MPQVDVRPAALDALARPGNTLTFTLTFPAGYLAGKTWSASVGGTPLTPVIVGDVMTIAISGTVTTALGTGRHTFLLTDTTGDDQVRIAGRILLTDSATSSPDQTVNVTVASSVAVAVTVASGEPGVAAGGTTGQVYAKASDVDYDAEWVDVAAGGGGAPSGPAGGVLGGTYPDPSFAVDMATQVELDAEAATRSAADGLLDGAIEAHRADTTVVHGIADTAALVLTGDARLSDARTPTAHAASHQDGGTDELALDGSQITSGTLDDARIPSSIARDTEITAAVSAAIDALLDGAPGALDTLNELAAAVNDDAGFAATVTAALAGKQPLDADLTAIAALATTSYGRAFLALADDAAGRTALGLGTAALSASGDFQPVDSDLTALAALTTTVYGRSLLETANAAGARTLLGLGTAAVAAQADLLARANHTGAQLAATVSDFDTQVRTSRLDQLAAPTADVPLNARKIIGLADPTLAQDAATRAYVLAVRDALLASAPGLLDTLDEIAAALADDPNFAATMTTALAGKQPLHADLTAIAALASAADKMPYSTGAQAWALTTLTNFARTLLDDADAATALATLGAAMADFEGNWPSGSILPFEGTSTTVAMVDQRVYYAPIWVPEARTTQSLELDITVAGAGGTPVIRTGIYSPDANGRPGALLGSDGTSVADAIAVVTKAHSQALPRGLHWVACVAQGATVTQPTMRAISGYPRWVNHTSFVTAPAGSGYLQSGVAGALPNPAVPSLTARVNAAVAFLKAV